MDYRPYKVTIRYVKPDRERLAAQAKAVRAALADARAEAVEAKEARREQAARDIEVAKWRGGYSPNNRRGAAPFPPA